MHLNRVKNIKTGFLFRILIFCMSANGSVNGQTIDFIEIDSVRWAQKNLAVIRFRNGDSLLLANSVEAWIEAGTKKQAAYCYYDENPDNVDKYGILYNWYAVTDPRGLAPEGWRMPSLNEWQKLITSVGGDDLAVKKIKSKTGWSKKRNGNNQTGLDAQPAGYKSSCGHFFDSATNTAIWWTSTADGNNTAKAIRIDSDSPLVKITGSNKGSGFSVRCIKE
jgi:uncharacterized protein (TIGR02145 family)